MKRNKEKKGRKKGKEKEREGKGKRRGKGEERERKGRGKGKTDKKRPCLTVSNGPFLMPKVIVFVIVLLSFVNPLYVPFLWKWLQSST